MALAAVMVFVCSNATARAEYAQHFAGFLHPQQQVASGTYPQLRKSSGYGYHEWTGAAAHLPGGWTLYGQYITGYESACHAYAAGNSLGAMLKNDSGLYDSYFKGWADTEVPC
jgi:hypothetical protein